MGGTSEMATVVTRLVAPEVLEELRRRVAPERLDAAAAFAHTYARRAAYEERDPPAPADLAGQIAGAFGLVDERGREPVLVRAFTPSRERDGYETPGSVVEACCDDMPFLVDSVTEELRTRNVGVRRGVHPIVGTERDEAGRLTRVARPRGAAHPESIMHFELDRRLGEPALAEIAEAVRARLDEVRRAVRDYGAMEGQIGRMVDIACARAHPEDDVDEIAAFLGWLSDGNFVFLGYREYDLVDLDDGPGVEARPQPRLGILSELEGGEHARTLEEIDPLLRDELTAGVPLLIGKTEQVSQVHRRRRMDSVSVRRLDAGGDSDLECRMIGLFTAKAYAEPSSRVPVLRTKLRHFLDSEEIIDGSHDERVATSLFDRFPKEELFAVAPHELRTLLLELLALHGSPRTRLLARVGEHGVSFVLALPHERYDDALVQRLRALLRSRCDGQDIQQHVSLDDQDPALVHFRVVSRTLPPEPPPLEELEHEVLALSRSWEERLTERLVAHHGVERALELSDRWATRFPEHYRAAASVEQATVDIERLEQLGSDGGDGFVIGIHNGGDRSGGLTRVCLYTTGGRVSLSDFTPVLESMGLEAVEEVPTHLRGDGNTFLQDFGVLGPDGGQLELSGCGERLTDAVASAWRGQTEADALNRLIISAGMNWRQVAVLRAYCTYRQRIGLGFTESHVNASFTDNPLVAKRMADYFELRFDPDGHPAAEEIDAVRKEVLELCDQVPSLDQDRVLREHLMLVEATVRTNAFIAGGPLLAFKIYSAAVPRLPEPRPYFEVFACSPDVEGIHLRGGPVARGGVRWSERREDYRNEVLGLMKAQLVKNSVISATGAKGGFVLKHPPSDPSALRAEAQRQYTMFMHALLDVTDNRVSGEPVTPPRVRALDGPDSYLVVAPDKGTATLSDVANSVAREHDFWLDDAFASGGSTGYDHKALGITARGAWESVKRHFSELELDVQTEPVTAVGIGDMSGDVFGNGMLCSEQLRLVAAFDHRHVFIDPDPDSATGYAERRRLFELPRSSWDDYDRAAISQGGGVWPRSAKSIPLSAEARAALGVEDERLAPSDVIRAILRAPVDLLWSAGIGTWAKASYETDDDAGDRASDAIRVDGRDLRCRVIGEGGNLGLTQRARVEYEQSGGRVFADFIDNVGGVDCSDREVNLKVLLGLAEERGELDRAGRDELLVAVTEDVVAATIEDSRRQAQVLTVESEASPERMLGYEELMRSLEAEGLLLGRDSEALPSSEEMAKRRGARTGMTRPELSILLAYAKRSMKVALLDCDLDSSLGIEDDLRRYFPPEVVARFGGLVAEHPLRRELWAAIAANDTVNTLGLPVASRLARETGSSPAEIVVAFRAARDTVWAVEHRRAIESLSGTIDPELWRELIDGHDDLVTTVTRWYLLNRVAIDIEHARAQYELLPDAVANALSLEQTERLEDQTNELAERGIERDLARRHALRGRLAMAPDMIAIGRLTGRSPDDVARAFVLAGHVFHIDRLESQARELWAGSAWQRWALQAVIDDLFTARRRLAQGLIERAGGGPIDAVLEHDDPERDRLDAFMRTLAVDGGEDLAALTVAARQIRNLAES